MKTRDIERDDRLFPLPTPLLSMQNTQPGGLDLIVLPCCSQVTTHTVVSVYAELLLRIIWMLLP